MSRHKSSVSAFGHIYDSLAAIAERILRLLVESPRTIWVDDDNIVFATPADDTRQLPAHWLAGTYGFGQPKDGIVHDLSAVLSERAKDWILD